VIRNDKTYLLYVARPSDNTWGTVRERGTWRIDTEKSPNTGKRHYAISLSRPKANKDAPVGWYSSGFLIFANDITLFEPWQESTLKKEDRFPFEE